jgi:uncharacterized membrane protein
MPPCCTGGACRYGLARGMPTLVYYLTRHYLNGLLGWGPAYSFVVVQEHAAKGLQQVCVGVCCLPVASCVAAVCYVCGGTAQRERYACAASVVQPGVVPVCLDMSAAWAEPLQRGPLESTLMVHSSEGPTAQACPACL